MIEKAVFTPVLVNDFHIYPQSNLVHKYLFKYQNCVIGCSNEINKSTYL